MQIGGKVFDLEQNAYIMGILNVTPDSFSDGGKYNQMDQALFHVEEMIGAGASIIDIGGESTRPGYQLISEEEEISRVVPIIEKVKGKFDTVISLDTYKSKVAKAGIDAGADLINDIWGLKYDPMMATVIAEAKVACCLMHNRDNMEYMSFLDDVKNDLLESVALAKKAGIEADKIILDPGVGFGKTYEHNLAVIHHMEDLLSIGYPILLGTSRKSVIGLTLNLPASERVEGTIATTVIGRIKGASIFRVHDVDANMRALKMTEAILQG